MDEGLDGGHIDFLELAGHKKGSDPSELVRRFGQFCGLDKAIEHVYSYK